MADQDEMNGLILSNLAKLAARLSVVAGDLRAVRGLLEQRAERTEFAEIVARLKQRGVIPEEFDAAVLDGAEERAASDVADVCSETCGSDGRMPHKCRLPAGHAGDHDCLYCQTRWPQERVSVGTSCFEEVAHG